MEHKKYTCITLLADKNYLHFFPKIYEQIREVGKFDGDINLITNKNKLKIKPKNFYNVNIFEFEQIRFSKDFLLIIKWDTYITKAGINNILNIAKIIVFNEIKHVSLEITYS